MGELRGPSGAKRSRWVRRAVRVFAVTFICVMLFAWWAADDGPADRIDPNTSGAPPGGETQTAAPAGFDFGSAATISAVAGLVTSVGVSASKIIGAVAELTRSRADLARARREAGAGGPAAVPAAGPEPAPGEDG
ncbi:hypothetical protein ACFVFS_16810 [Kitasatospora sp. NPDC057692]|uniref:hypothetical protein n=1 Tax=Kitasatospora sp. NPDC057692 TaxID=3346215 RepID=UPI0036CF3DFC